MLKVYESSSSVMKIANRTGFSCLFFQDVCTSCFELQDFIISTCSVLLVYQFARADVTKYWKQGDRNNRNVLVHSSASQKYNTKVLAKLVSFEKWEGGPVPDLSSLTYTRPSFPGSLHIDFPLCLSVSKFPFYIRTPVIGFGPTLMTSFLLITSIMTLFPNKVTF